MNVASLPLCPPQGQQPGAGRVRVGGREGRARGWPSEDATRNRELTEIVPNFLKMPCYKTWKVPPWSQPTISLKAVCYPENHGPRASGALASGRPAEDQGAEEHLKKSRNEGRTHDLIDNKGSILGTHDLYENK